MTNILLLAGLALLIPFTARADHDGACHSTGCPTVISFASISDSRTYGLLIAAPYTGCRHVRFRVEGADSGYLGQSPPLDPGALAVIRLGRGFPAGENRVTVASVGCDTPPAATRRVIFDKAGPDHGWRAAEH
jgi:hypothetical protein